MGLEGRIPGSNTEAVNSSVKKHSQIADPFSRLRILSWHLAHLFPDAVWTVNRYLFTCSAGATLAPRHDARWGNICGECVLGTNLLPSRCRKIWIRAMAPSFFRNTNPLRLPKPLRVRYRTRGG